MIRHLKNLTRHTLAALFGSVFLCAFLVALGMVTLLETAADAMNPEGI